MLPREPVPANAIVTGRGAANEPYCLGNVVGVPTRAAGLPSDMCYTTTVAKVITPTWASAAAFQGLHYQQGR